jgi:DNA replication protein DnaC
MMELLLHESKTLTLTCPKHGGYTGNTIKFTFLGREKEMNPPCPVCEREIAEAKERGESERRRFQEEGRFRDMNIENRFYQSGFDTFNAYNDELRAHLETCRRFAERPNGKLVMLGENGNGKTHLAVSILKAVGGVMYTAYEIGMNIRQGYREGKERGVFDELCSVPLLVIDEVEKAKDSEAKHQWMSYVVGKRYNRLLPIVFIANCHIQRNCRERQKPCPYCLEYHLENDVLSRIMEDGIIMNFTCEDYRGKIRASRSGDRL